MQDNLGSGGVPTDSAIAVRNNTEPARTSGVVSKSNAANINAPTRQVCTIDSHMSCTTHGAFLCVSSVCLQHTNGSFGYEFVSVYLFSLSPHLLRSHF